MSSKHRTQSLALTLLCEASAFLKVAKLVLMNSAGPSLLKELPGISGNCSGDVDDAPEIEPAVSETQISIQPPRVTVSCSHRA